MKMKAAVVREPQRPAKVSVEEVNLDPPKENEVLVKVSHTGLCHSDTHGIVGDLSYPVPIVMGHETSGIVEEVGPGVTDLKVGDHVVCVWQVPCGHCPECAKGRGEICMPSFAGHQTGTLMDGTSRLTDQDGKMIHHAAYVSGFAEYLVAPAAGAIKIRKDMPLDQACFMGCCVPTGLGAVWNAAGVKPTQSVAIWGLGGVGLNVLRGAALVNAYPLIAVDLNPDMEEMAMEFGATHFICNAKDDPVPIIQELTGGVGVEFAFEAIGDPGAIVQAWWTVKAAGSLVQVGITPQDKTTPLPLTFMPMQRKNIIGAMYGHVSVRYDIPKLCDMAMRGLLKLDKLITGTFELDDIEDAVNRMVKWQMKGRELVAFD